MQRQPAGILANKRIVLVGAAGGIGCCIARRLTDAGATLLMVDRNAQALQPLAANLNQAWIAVDLGSAAGRDRLAGYVEPSWGAADGLVNCAGVSAFGLQDAVSDQQVESVITVNLTMPMLVIRRLLPLLQSGRNLVIVNLGSVFGHIGFPGFAAYSASKFGLHGFTEALRRELAGGPIRVAWISPRATRTAMNAGPVDAMNEELGVRYDTPESVAAAVSEALARPRRDRVLGFPEKLFARINQLFPSLVDRSLLQQLPIVRKYSSQQKEDVS
jgi:short-subunit dehydrogenase